MTITFKSHFCDNPCRRPRRTRHARLRRDHGPLLKDSRKPVKRKMKIFEKVLRSQEKTRVLDPTRPRGRRGRQRHDAEGRGCLHSATKSELGDGDTRHHGQNLGRRASLLGYGTRFSSCAVGCCEFGFLQVMVPNTRSRALVRQSHTAGAANRCRRCRRTTPTGRWQILPLIS